MAIGFQNQIAAGGSRHRLKDLLSRFTEIFGRMAGQMAHGRRWLIVSVIACDLVAAAARIGALLLVAAAVSLFSSQGSANLFGVTISHAVDVDVIVMFGVAIGVTASAGALATYQSARLARRLGRWMNLHSMHDIYSVISAAPARMLASRFEFRNDLNVVLTQVPIHCGLAAETMTRLAQPLFMMLFSGLILFYQQPLFTAGAAFLGLFFLPFILRQSSAVQRNARSFYGETAVQLGVSVTALASQVVGQHGIVEKPRSITDQAQVGAFFDSYDFNLLANERVGLIVAMADALLRPVLFVILSILVLFGEFSIQSVIGFLGSLAYLLASSRTVASLLTNLLRYHPQVVRYYEFLDAAAPAQAAAPPAAVLPDTLQIEALSPQGIPRPLEWRRGEPVMMASAQSLNALTLGQIVPPLLGKDTPAEAVTGALVFASSAFRFAPVALMDQLCGGKRTSQREARARALCLDLGANRAFEALAQGYETGLSESTWNTLDAPGRVALRLVPLCLAQKPAFVVLDLGVIQALGLRAWPVIEAEFATSFLVVVASPQAGIIDYPVAHYLSLEANGSLSVGDRVWFEQIRVATRNSASGDSGVIAASAML